jgi:hypothetical protein
MELARLEEQIPSCRARTIRPSEAPGEDEQTGGIEEPQDDSDDELGMLEPDQGNNGLGEPGQQHRADECPGDGARECEVVIRS